MSVVQTCCGGNAKTRLCVGMFALGATEHLIRFLQLRIVRQRGQHPTEDDPQDIHGHGVAEHGNEPTIGHNNAQAAQVEPLHERTLMCRDVSPV